MMVIVVFSSTAYTHWQKSHVTMDILTSKLTEPHRALLAVATTLWSLATIGFCSYTTARYAASTSSVTLVLRIRLPHSSGSRRSASPCSPSPCSTIC